MGMSIDTDSIRFNKKILGPNLIHTQGEIYYADSVNGNDADGAGKKVTTPVASIRYLFETSGKLTASSGDIIYCLPGHVEPVSAAAYLDLDIAGVTIVFLGYGDERAQINFTTLAAADMDIDAASITLINPRFVAGVDSLTGPIDVNAEDFTIINGLWEDATDIETTDCIVAEDAHRLTIDGWKYNSVTETGDQKQSNIQLNNCDDIMLKNIDIRGDFFVGCIENVTDEILNARLENVSLENLNATPKPALFLDANATGACKNVELHVASGTTYANSYGKMSWDPRCMGYSGTSSPTGDALGTAPATGVEGQVSQAVSEVGSVGVIASTVLSETGSVGVVASSARSEAGSVGVIASSILSEVGSLWAVISTKLSVIDSQVS